MLIEGQDRLQVRLQSLNDALDSGALSQVRRILNEDLQPAEIAHLLETSPPRQRALLWRLIDNEQYSEILPYLADEIQTAFIQDLDVEALVSLGDDFELDDFADLLQQLPEAVIGEVLGSMDHQDRQRIEAVLAYDEESAGGLMNTDVITVRPDITVEVALRYLRQHRELPEGTDSLVVVNRRDEYIGILPLTRLLVCALQTTVREIVDTEFEAILDTTPDDEVARRFERLDLVSAPVVNAEGRLLGRITIDDVVDVIREDAEHEILSMAGLDEEEDMFAPTLKTARSRAIWLGVNLLTALLASAVIGIFEETIAQVVALAVLMPIVASMGGIAGSQALTLVIRGMATGKIDQSNLAWLVNRELIVGALNGLLWSSVVAIAAMIWFQDYRIGALIAAALVINLIVAAVAGTLLPSILKKLRIDPALAGGVILTTITDVVGFFSFLGLATLAYA